MSAAQRNLGELYRQRERSEWYWRALATLAAGLILLGFLVFPASFPTWQGAQNQGTLSIVSVVLLALGFSLSVALWFICRSWLFQFDVLFAPCLFSCLLGVANIAIALGTHESKSWLWSASTISALSLSLASSAIYGGLCIFTWRRIRAARLRSPIDPLTGRERSAEHAGLIEHDDQQRKVWARLLNPRPADVSGASSASTTFHLDIPDHVRLGESARGDNSRSTTSREGTTGSSAAHGSNTYSGGAGAGGHSGATSTTLLAGSNSSNPNSAGYGSAGAATSPAGLFGGENHVGHGQQAAAGPRAQLTPTAAALQQARERTLHNERSMARLQSGRTPSPYGDTAGSGSLPRTGTHGSLPSPPPKDERFQGPVHRPTDEFDEPDRGADARDDGPMYEVVNVPNFQIPLASIRKRPPDEFTGPRELEARMADRDRRR